MENKAPKSRLLWSIPCAHLLELQLSSPDEEQPQTADTPKPKSTGREVKSGLAETPSDKMCVNARMYACIHLLE